MCGVVFLASSTRMSVLECHSRYSFTFFMHTRTHMYVHMWHIGNMFKYKFVFLIWCFCMWQFLKIFYWRPVILGFVNLTQSPWYKHESVFLETAYLIAFSIVGFYSRDTQMSAIYIGHCVRFCWHCKYSLNTEHFTFYEGEAEADWVESCLAQRSTHYSSLGAVMAWLSVCVWTRLGKSSFEWD